MEGHDALDLIVTLCKTLAVKNIDYCHWKSNAFLDRSASGENDLDLLVNRCHARYFLSILSDLGFKESLLHKEEEIPGVRNYYGYDQNTGRLVHIHAHFQLILGSDLTKNYRLPLEKDYLDSSVQGDLFRVPTTEFELMVFVIRMVLKHSTWDSILIRHGRLTSTERHELDVLSTQETLSKVQSVLLLLPGLNRNLFDLCLQSLQPDCPYWMRIKAGEKLQKVLQSCVRYPHWHDLISKFARRVWQTILRRGFKYAPKERIANGGLFISIVGGDGAGKTTLIDGLHDWLSVVFEVRKIHIGKPVWSWTTTFIRGLLKVGTLLGFYPFEGDVYEDSFKRHGYPWFIRAVCTARDRYLTYFQGRRFSSNGSLVLCDRYSLPGFMKMDGPQCENAIMASKKTNRFLKFLTLMENSYYRQIKLPDLLIVLKVDPEIAILRKPEESEISVRARSTEVWELDWDRLSAVTINANKSKKEILSQVKALVWENL